MHMSPSLDLKMFKWRCITGSCTRSEEKSRLGVIKEYVRRSELRSEMWVKKNEEQLPRKTQQTSRVLVWKPKKDVVQRREWQAAP